MNKSSLHRPRRRQACPTNTRSVSTQPAPTVILHVKIWYDGGTEGEINLISPNLVWGEFVETQYIYLKQYLHKVGGWMKLEAYQASICFPRPDGSFKTLTTYAKVLFSSVQPFTDGQACQCQKGGQNRG